MAPPAAQQGGDTQHSVVYSPQKPLQDQFTAEVNRILSYLRVLFPSQEIGVFLKHVADLQKGVWYVTLPSDIVLGDVRITAGSHNYEALVAKGDVKVARDAYLASSRSLKRLGREISPSEARSLTGTEDWKVLSMSNKEFDLRSSTGRATNSGGSGPHSAAPATVPMAPKPDDKRRPVAESSATSAHHEMREAARVPLPSEPSDWFSDPEGLPEPTFPEEGSSTIGRTSRPPRPGGTMGSTARPPRPGAG